MLSPVSTLLVHAGSLTDKGLQLCTSNCDVHGLQRSTSVAFTAVCFRMQVASSELPAKASQPYINLLADVVASLVRDGYGEEAARVCLLVIASGNLRTATRISTTMVKRRHYCEAAKVSACLVAAGHEDFRATLAGEPRPASSFDRGRITGRWCRGLCWSEQEDTQGGRLLASISVWQVAGSVITPCLARHMSLPLESAATQSTRYHWRFHCSYQTMVSQLNVHTFGLYCPDPVLAWWPWADGQASLGLNAVCVHALEP